MRDSPLVLLAGVFVPPSLMSVGGGQSILAEAHRQVVQQHHWLTEQQFVNDYLLSRMSPGPNSLIVMLIGAQTAGVLGAVVTLVAMFLPSSLLVYGVAHVWTRHAGAAWRSNIERGMAPIAAGLILSTGWTLLRGVQGGWSAWLLAVAAAATLMLFRWHPLLLIAAGAAVFLGLGAGAGALGVSLP